MSLLRGIADDVALRPGCRITSGRAKALSVAGIRRTMERCIAAGEMLAGGVTCCADQYFFPDAAARAYQASGMRAISAWRCSIFLRRTPWMPMATCNQGSPRATSGSTSRCSSFALAPHAPYTVGDASWREDRRLCAAARSADPDAPAGDAATSARAASPIRHRSVARACIVSGVTGPDFIAVHGAASPAADIELLVAAALPRRALPGIEPQARQRHRAGRRN